MSTNYIIKLEDINDRLAKGLYGDIDITFLKENDYISANKLCKYGLTKNGNTKEFSDWLKKKQAKALIEKVNKRLNSSSGNSGLDSIIYLSDLPIEHRGYYIHKLVAIQVAQWISVEFAIRISEMYDDYARVKYESEVNKKDKQITEMQIMIEEIRIKRMEDKIKYEEDKIRHEEAMQKTEEAMKRAEEESVKSKERHQELIGKHDEQLVEIKDLKETVEEQGIDIEHLTGLLEDSNLHTNVIRTNILPKVKGIKPSIPITNPEDIEYLVLLRLPCSSISSHYSIRGNKKAIESAIRRLKKRKINYEYIFASQVTNSVVLYKNMQDKFIIKKGNEFYLKPNISESQLIDGINNYLRELGDPIIELEESLKLLNLLTS